MPIVCVDLNLSNLNFNVNFYYRMREIIGNRKIKCKLEKSYLHIILLVII